MESDTSIVRSIAVGLAMCFDIACNYPLWIAAKRIGANLSPFPSDLKNLYKGGGTLWLSLGPTTIIEDKVTNILNATFSDDDRQWYSGLLSAATSGMVAAMLVTSQVEYLITASHTEAKTVTETFRLLCSRHGIHHIVLPPGIVAMVGREIPFASALFFVRPMIYEYMRNDEEMVKKTLFQDLQHSFRKIMKCAICGILTSALVTPLSQAPSVIAAYQQGHGVTILQAVKDIRKQYGWPGFFRGLPARTFSLAGTFTVVPLVLEELDGILIS